ncbi:PqqD family protein [Paenibacillus jamilae]|uniref:PqqD family protein n=1 Tax=Paenibacillus TaxID=44249 RepID=UPI000E3B5A46|nr:PqqD family protein [Paenibacillus jamilae]RFT97708.1 PqqD family protein [Paenibacillus jamilae]
MKYARNVFIQTRILNDKTYAVKNNDVYLLDEVAYKIWSLLDGERTVGEIAVAIAEEYKADKETVFKDVNEFIQELKNVDFVEVV